MSGEVKIKDEVRRIQSLPTDEAYEACCDIGKRFDRDSSNLLLALGESDEFYWRILRYVCERIFNIYDFCSLEWI